MSFVVEVVSVCKSKRVSFHDDHDTEWWWRWAIGCCSSNRWFSSLRFRSSVSASSEIIRPWKLHKHFMKRKQWNNSWNRTINLLRVLQINGKRCTFAPQTVWPSLLNMTPVFSACPLPSSSSLIVSLTWTLINSLEHTLVCYLTRSDSFQRA